MREKRHTLHRKAAAELLWLSRRLGRWQVQQCEHVSRRDNNVLFEAEMHMKFTAKRVSDSYEGV